MTVAVKYLILIVGFISAFSGMQSGAIGSGFTAAGAFIAFALLEIQDMKTINQDESNEEKVK